MHVKGEKFAWCPSGFWSFQSPMEQRVPPHLNIHFFGSPHACHMPETQAECCYEQEDSSQA